MCRLFMPLALLVVAAALPVTAAEIAPEDVILKVEIESWGQTHGLSPVAAPEASGGVAMALAADANAVGAVRLDPGEYTLVLWATAPAGDADGFFVEINGQRTRLLGRIGRWDTLSLPFTVTQAGPVIIQIIGQEPGLTIDQIAVVRGSYPQGQIAFANIPGEAAGQSISLEDIPRLSGPCALKEVSDTPFAPDERTVLHESFDAPCTGVVGEHRWGEGRFGPALILDMPDGRFDLNTAGLDIAEQGTIELWVKTRPAARVWWDQGWHYLLHFEPAQPGGTQLDLSLLCARLELTATLDGTPYPLAKGTNEVVGMNTGALDNEAWHHLLVSWDLRGDRQYLWLLVDGKGVRGFFPRAFAPGAFSRIEIGNTPSDWDVPFLPLDGAIDELRITNTSVADRIAE